MIHSLTFVSRLKIETERSRILPAGEASFTHGIATGGMSVLGAEHDPGEVDLFRIKVEIDSEIECLREVAGGGIRAIGGGVATATLHGVAADG